MGEETMGQNPITKKITRRLFNGVIAVGAFFGLQKKVEADPHADPYADEYMEKCHEELENTDYMEVLIIPEEYRYPYSDKTNKVLLNHLKAGKSRYEIKQFIISRCKVIKVPIK